MARFSHPPAIVFVTAHEEHALAAFDVGRLGYLLKPVTQERLVTASAAGGATAPEEHADEDALETIPVEIGTSDEDGLPRRGLAGSSRRATTSVSTCGTGPAPGPAADVGARGAVGDHGFARIHRSYLVVAA